MDLLIGGAFTVHRYVYVPVLLFKVPLSHEQHSFVRFHDRGVPCGGEAFGTDHRCTNEVALTE